MMGFKITSSLKSIPRLYLYYLIFFLQGKWVIVKEFKLTKGVLYAILLLESKQLLCQNKNKN